ncbi:MAG: tRNA (adenosine(37)-N6)-threonylcarbamoyltransferase complex transferase subunit TsaD [Elusimicrobia bacterium]|nr:tRNA (adenosine(37)-N6)-threonylcarbamoyltransferase complex transferase subunit TsaD [Elusimicrobiota bacterium]
MQLVLGIETSCDETAVGIVELTEGSRGRYSFKIRANVLSSQIPLHAPYFGVVPELASRAHLEKMTGVLHAAIAAAGLKPDPAFLNKRLATVAYTQGPGLKGALLVGESAGRALALALERPAMGVHHLEAHLAAILLEHPGLKPPFLGLIISGGHTDLVHVRRWGDYRVLGRTLDDACGEAFDKFSKMLQLGYPGGPIVDKMAKSGDPKKVPFPRPYLKNSWNFSFSGLKTSALYRLRDHGHPRTRKEKNDLAASYQESICETLIFKAKKALRVLNLDQLVVSGGVAANSRLRYLLAEEGRRGKFDVYFPSPSLCTDNGAMIAAAAALRFVSGAKPSAGPVDPTLPFPRWS